LKTKFTCARNLELTTSHFLTRVTVEIAVTETALRL